MFWSFGRWLQASDWLTADNIRASVQALVDKDGGLVRLPISRTMIFGHQTGIWLEILNFGEATKTRLVNALDEVRSTMKVIIRPL